MAIVNVNASDPSLMRNADKFYSTKFCDRTKRKKPVKILDKFSEIKLQITFKLETNIFGVVKVVISGVNYNRDVLYSTQPNIVFVINGNSF